MNNRGNINLPITYDKLTVGYEFPRANYEMSLPVVSKYLEGVGIKSSQSVDFVPPLALAARTIAAMSESLVLPAGVIHASQDLEFHKLVPIGTKIECHSRVAQKLDRGKMHLLSIEFDVYNQDNEKVQSGKSTLVLSE
ncbi:MaoC family dehydratase N-terminal domain-containing protein [Chloroflexota bacterium]